MKRIFSFALMVLIMVTLAACQNPAKTESASGTTQGTSATDPTVGTTENTPEATDPTQPSATEPVIKTRYLCTEEKYTTSDGSGGVTTRTYDEQGNLLSDFYKSNSSDVAYGDSYSYDEKGNVLTHKTYDNHSRLSSETTNTYNEAGQLISQLFTSSEGSIYTRKSDFTYDENGLLVKKVDTNPDDTNSPVHSEFHYVYSYDEKGNLIKEDWINVNDGIQTPHSWKAWTYDAKGNKLSETDNRGFKTEWTYDDRGNMLSETQYDDIGNVWLGSVYTYDEENRVLTEGMAKGDIHMIMEGFVNEYDEAGRKIARYRCYNSLDKANAVRIFQYTYDEFGNVLKETACTPSGTETSWREYKYIAIELPKE